MEEWSRDIIRKQQYSLCSTELLLNSMETVIIMEGDVSRQAPYALHVQSDEGMHRQKSIPLINHSGTT